MVTAIYPVSFCSLRFRNRGIHDNRRSRLSCTISSHKSVLRQNFFTVYQIYSTCKNTAINYLQKKGGLKEFSFEDLSATVPAEEDPRLLLEENDEDVEALHRAWKRLDPRSQYLLEARYILNKSFEEIAADINIQPDSVRAALSRARKKARKLILEEKAL